MQYELDIYIMVKSPLIYFNNLIISRKKMLTFIFVLTSFGSHTYSRITTNHIQTTKDTPSKLILQKTNSICFNIYFLTPISYTKHSTKERLKAITPSEVIMNIGTIEPNTLARFLINTNKNIDTNYAQTLAKIYVEEANHEGVNPDIAFAQMCLETGFLRFDGTVDKHQNNFCGLGVIGNGAKGLIFKDAREGIRAHIQHLKAYASTGDLKNKLVDKRFNYVKRGSATNINQLTGRWAVDVKYDHKIRNLLNRLYKYSG